MEKLVLIDGNGLMHRAFHAMPELTNRDGQPVNAVYGFFSMLLQLLNDQKPDYLAVCFDRTKPTIRQAMYAGYHAHRPQMESTLSSQFGLVDELLHEANIQVFGLDGYEGDDLIGTIASRVSNETKKLGYKDRKKKEGKSSDIDVSYYPYIETIIVTGDRDMLQLVSPTVKILMPQNGLSKTLLFDTEKVEEKYGVKPIQFIDYKALIGDVSDGYPGVTGIGPKTAASLLQKFGTFEDLYKQIDEVPEKLALKLATDAEQAALAKKLATIITDAPIQFEISDCACSHIDLLALHRGFAKHSFMSLLNRLEARNPGLKEKAYQKTRPQLNLFD